MGAVILIREIAALTLCNRILFFGVRILTEKENAGTIPIHEFGEFH